jgi:lambda repressor-like predicted transcriptional regulator
MYRSKLVQCLGVDPADLREEYGEAEPYVVQLAWLFLSSYTGRGDALDLHHKREKLIQIISRDYPRTAEKLGLSLKRSALLSTALPVNEATAPKERFRNIREAFIMLILDKKGWSIHRLAVEAQLDFHTVNDYLKGKTRPNRSTRKALADALEVPVENLPR